MTIELYPKSIFRTLLVIVIALTIANIVVNIINLNFFIDNGIWSGNKYIKILINLFDFDTEAKNLPTFYSAVALLLCSMILWIISIFHKANKEKYIPWLGLALIFCFLSLDEILALHEHLVLITKNLFNLSGFGEAYWIIPYGIALIFFTIVYSKFLLSLPRNIIKLMVISAFVFISGSIGFDLLQQIQFELHGRSNWPHALLYTCEEFLEMFGVIIFIYALTSYKSIAIKIN